jgi:hypothetical protein
MNTRPTDVHAPAKPWAPPEGVVPSAIFQTIGAAPSPNTKPLLKTALKTFDRLPDELMQFSLYQTPYWLTVCAMIGDCFAARDILLEGDGSKVADWGKHPALEAVGAPAMHVNLSRKEFFEFPYGVSLAFLTDYGFGATAFVMRGDDGNRLRSFTIVTLRDVEGVNQAVPRAHFDIHYVPGEDGGGLRPKVYGDPNVCDADRDLMHRAYILLWYRERWRLGDKSW